MIIRRRKRARLSQKTRFGINPLDQPVHALIAGTQPPARAAFPQARAVFRPARPPLPRGSARFAIGDLRIRRAECESCASSLSFSPSAGPRRAASSGSSRAPFSMVCSSAVMARIWNIKISLARVAEHGNAFRFGHLRGSSAASPCGAHENRHITVAAAFPSRFWRHKTACQPAHECARRQPSPPLDGGQFPLPRPPRLPPVVSAPG